MFIERIQKDTDKKLDHALTGVDIWTSLSNVHGHNMVSLFLVKNYCRAKTFFILQRILTSCIRIFELCEQIGNLIKNMESYTQRFASLWLVIMEEYTRSATEMYQRVEILLILHFIRSNL
jgi:hypothetical protein